MTNLCCKTLFWVVFLAGGQEERLVDTLKATILKPRGRGSATEHRKIIMYSVTILIIYIKQAALLQLCVLYAFDTRQILFANVFNILE